MTQPQTEDLIKFIWLERLYDKVGLKTTTNQNIIVYSPGSRSNEDGQPLLSNAEIAINETVFRGDIAFSNNSSDWRRSKHTNADNNVILHVVKNSDSTICNANGEPIPTLAIQFNTDIEELYKHLTSHAKSCGCAETFASLEPINRYSILTRMAIERLENKYNAFLEIYTEVGSNWNEAFYIMLFRYIEMGQNKDSFMRLAHIVPYNIICRVRDNIQSVEALLFGSAGFLYAVAEDEYTLKLQQEFDHLRHRFKIEPMRNSEWITSGNPSNHPAVRIAELSSLLSSQELIFAKLAECRTLDNLQSILKASASEYWDTHYSLGKTTPHKVKRLGSDAVHILGINLVTTMLFAQGQQKGDDNLKERAIEILEQFKAESNQYINSWKRKGIKIENAFFSQALIQLTTKYCLEQKCTECSIGKLRLCNVDKK